MTRNSRTDMAKSPWAKRGRGRGRGRKDKGAATTRSLHKNRAGHAKNVYPF